MYPGGLVQALRRDLLNIYDRAGREVRYTDDRGKERAYWPRRYNQALKRAIRAERTVMFAEELVSTGEPSRGFFILQDAGRLDLTVEALIADESRPYHGILTATAVAAAQARLNEHAGVTSVPARPATSGQTLDVSPGSTFYLRVTVGDGGELKVAVL
jgi:hypothetical protein